MEHDEMQRKSNTQIPKQFALHLFLPCYGGDRECWARDDASDSDHVTYFHHEIDEDYMS